MASYVVKLKEKYAFWAAADDAAWTDKIEEAKVYAKKAEAEEALGEEIPTYYELEVVDPAKVPAPEAPAEEESAEEAPAEEPAAE